MAINKIIPRGTSITLTYVFPEDYDMSRIVKLETVVGQTVFDHVIENQTAIVRLKSSDTQAMFGTQAVTLMVEDTLLGVQKPYSGIITVGASKSSYSSDAVSALSSLVIPIVIDETIITSGDILYNYFRCKSAFELAVEGGYPGTEPEFNEDLAMFRFWSEQAELAAQQTAADAIQTALDRIATGEDRVQTGQDRVQTGQDVQSTASNVIQTGFDVQTTAQAVIDSESARDKAQEWASNPEDVPVETGKFSALHWAAKALATFNNIVAAISGKEDSANKRSTFQATPTNTAYPSEKLVKDSLDLKADKSTVTQKIYLMLYEVATVVTGVITAVKKLWTEYSDRVTADAGTTTSLTNTERIYKMQVDNGSFNHLAFGWAADGGYKPRTSGVLTFFTKIYNFFGTNDAAQATALNQPYRFFDGGMKNVGVLNSLAFSSIARTAAQPWSCTFVVDITGNTRYKSIVSQAAAVVSTIMIDIFNVTLRNELNTAIAFTNAASFVGKKMIFTMVANGAGSLTLYRNGALVSTVAANTQVNFNSIMTSHSSAFVLPLNGNIYSVNLYLTALTQSQITAEHALLSTLYPEIPSVTIGSQTWQLYNNEMVATPMGNVIPQVTDPAIWATSQTIYDNTYAATSGTVAQKTTAALRAAAMWRYPNNDSAIGSWAGKQINKFVAKLMQEDILAFNAANPSTPWGYAVPTRAQLTTLAAIGGNAAKVTGNSYWNTANGTNTSGLSLLGTGFIQADGTYTDNKASTLLMCHDADFARKVVDGDNTFDEVAITTEGGVLRFIKV